MFWKTLSHLGAAVFIGLIAAAAPAQAQFQATEPKERVDYWQQRVRDIERRLASDAPMDNVDLLFVGDSITDFWLLSAMPWAPTQKGGKAIWDQSFGGGAAPYNAFNIGVSGDRTEHVLYRVTPQSEGGLGQLDRQDLQPKVIMVMIGINNSWNAEEPAVDSIAAGSIAVVEAVRALRPDAKIVVQSLVPTSDPARNADIVQPVNKRLKGYAEDQPGSMVYLDLYSAFVDDQGALRSELYMDAVHPAEAGYAIWRDELILLLEALTE